VGGLSQLGHVERKRQSVQKALNVRTAFPGLVFVMRHHTNELGKCHQQITFLG